jgi:hypothetical protein
MWERGTIDPRPSSRADLMPRESNVESAGVALIADLLARLAGDSFNAATFARQTGAARSSVYDAVARLEIAGFLERDSQGGLTPGVNAARLGLASLRLAALAPAAEALLPALRDETDATVSLVSIADGAEVPLMRRIASWDRESAAGREMEANIAAAVSLRIRLRPRISETERRFARACLERVATALRDALEAPSNCDHPLVPRVR